MFSIFKKKSKIDQLQDQYKRLMEEAYRLSTTNRAQSDLKHAEADELLKKIEEISPK